jgi:hypothetical protein
VERRALPPRLIGLHLLDPRDIDERRRVDRVPEILLRPFTRPARPTRLLPARPDPTATAVAPLPVAAPARAEPLPRPTEADGLAADRAPLGGTPERFGRGLVRGTEDLKSFTFLRLLDRFHARPPAASDPLQATREDLEREDRNRHFHDRAKRAVTSLLRHAVEETDLIGPIVLGIERLPQNGIQAIESVVEDVAGDEDALDLGELRLGTMGGSLRSPSQMVALRYSLGLLRADVYPTQARIRLSQQVAGFRIALRGNLDYGDAGPEARIEVVRRLGGQWRFRLTAGTGVGFNTIPVFTAASGGEEPSGIRSGTVAFFERRF